MSKQNQLYRSFGLIIIFMLGIIYSATLKGQERLDTVGLTKPDNILAKLKADLGDSWILLRGFDTIKLFAKRTFIDSSADHNGWGSFYGNGTLNWFNDVKELEFAVTGFNEKEADSFIYHITMNDSIELVPWSKPKEFRSNKSATYAYLGKFECANKMIRLEMYRLNEYQNRIIASVNNMYLPPADLKMAVLQFNNTYLSKPYQQVYIPRNASKYFSKEDIAAKKMKFVWTDSIAQISIHMTNTIQNDMYNVYLKKIVNGKTDTIHISNNWNITYHSKDPFALISASYFREPGEYEILVVPEPPMEFKRPVEIKTKIPFTVLPGKTTSYSLKELLIVLGIAIVIGLLIFWFLRTKHKRKLGSEKQQKEMISLQLRSVRDSLNPHFIFNALAGIQNLMNKKDTENANLYLSRFARITRSVLNTRENDRISLKEEISLLEDYLQMEQLRFGFKYYIYKDEKLDENNIDIPVLLIQPFVENAIKHGISSLKQDGRVDIRFKKTNNRINIEIEDNGKGFDTNSIAKGMGISLTEKRIELLNTAFKPALIRLQKKSGSKGTMITIILENWV